MNIASLDDIKHLQRIDLPLQIYQSKPKKEAERIRHKKSDSNFMLLMIIIPIISLFYGVVEAEAVLEKSMSGVIVLILLYVPIVAIVLWFYRLSEKGRKHLNILAELDLPDIYPLIYLNKDNFQFYDRENRLLVDVPVSQLKSVIVSGFHGSSFMELQLNDWYKNQKKFCVNMNDIEFFIKIEEIFYPISFGGIVYFIDLVRFLQKKNPDMMYFHLNKKHFINSYPINDKWIDI